MIDRSFIGASLAESTLSIDAARLKFFAEAIGETNPIYVDDDAARAAGHGPPWSSPYPSETPRRLDPVLQRQLQWSPWHGEC